MSDATEDMTVKLSLAERLLDALAFDERFDKRFDAALHRLGEERGELSELARARAQRIEQRRDSITSAQVRPAIARYYAERLDEGDLRGLVDFFESPMGGRFVRIWGSEHTAVRDILVAAQQALAPRRGAASPPSIDSAREKT